MRTLFAKILLWFVATILLTAAGFTLITAHSLAPSGERFHPLARLVPFQLREARFAYESGGKPALEAFLGRLRSSFPAEAILTDAEGRDLVTGQVHSELVRRASLGTRFPILRRERLVLSSPSEDGRYWFFLVVSRAGWPFWFFQPRYLWVMGIGVVLCYALALYLSAPLRRLQRAVEQFGHGDLAARVNSRRHDELGELARTFDQMADRLQTLVSAERRLLLDISHEIRSPLSRLGLAVELARSGEDREAALNRIQREADRLNALVGGLLQVTRGEGDPSSLRMEPVQLDELVKAIAEDCSIEAAERKCSMRIEESEPVQVHGDAELLRRAVENVVRNAIRYAPEGSAVEIRLARDAASACVSVRDHGPGVPEASLPRLFEAFYRVEEGRERTRGGAGLGLAITRRAVELHQGKVSARNADPGLLVELELPAG